MKVHVVLVVVALIVVSYSYGFIHGKSVERLASTSVVQEMEQKLQDRRKTYELVVKSHNERLTKLDKDLAERLVEINKLKESSNDTCVNSIIPADFK